MHIRISLGTKFQFKLISLIFLNKICPKRDFLVEKRKIALVRACYLLIFPRGAGRRNGISMCLLLVTETIITSC